MKGVRFYIEYNSPADKRRDTRSGNVVAVFPGEPANPGRIAGVMSVYFYANSPVTFGEIGFEFLRTQCKRVSEEEARAEGHSHLFEMVEEIVADEKKYDCLHALINATPDCVGVAFHTGVPGHRYYCVDCANGYGIAQEASTPESVKTEFAPLKRNSAASYGLSCDYCHAYLDDTQGTPALEAL